MEYILATDWLYQPNTNTAGAAPEAAPVPDWAETSENISTQDDRQV